jgi:nicotinamide-nucleotide amidase
MLAEIITIGDEILIGQVVDTNSAWMGRELSLAGIQVKQISSISDNKECILIALKEAAQRADIILITGGLGPTRDDITKKTLCDFFNDKLIFNESIYKEVEQLFFSRGLPMLDVNRMQAELPSSCIILRNSKGTAPGMWFEKDGKVFVSMPGVPYEMKAIMTEHVLPKLKGRFALPFIYHKTILTQGIGESFLAEIIKEWEDNLEKEGIKLAYLPRPGMVRLRLSFSGEDAVKVKSKVENEVEKVIPLIKEYVYGFEEFGEEMPTLQSVIGELLKKSNQTVSTAESCTGGYIAHLITSVPGSSKYYQGSVVAYANEFKVSELDVPEELIKNFGAVSRESVSAMAEGIRKKAGTTYSISTSGIAGPDGGSDDKPVGMVWIAVSGPKGTVAEKFQFGGGREQIIARASNAALQMLRKQLLG